jgi:hypothetical protein
VIPTTHRSIRADAVFSVDHEEHGRSARRSLQRRRLDWIKVREIERDRAYSRRDRPSDASAGGRDPMKRICTDTRTGRSARPVNDM